MNCAGLVGDLSVNYGEQQAAVGIDGCTDLFGICGRAQCPELRSPFAHQHSQIGLSM